MTELVSTTIDGRIAHVVLDRPQKLNALNNPMLEAFSAAIAELGANDDVSVIVLSGAGGNFSVGFDVDPGNGYSDAAADLSPYADWASLRRNIDRWLAVWDTPKPVISAIEGYCMGGATMLAVCTDITVVSETAVLGWPAIPLGGGLLSPTSAWLIGPKKAKELSFIAGSRLSGAEATALGWANHAVPAGTALERADALATSVAKMPLDLLRIKKLALNRFLDQQGFRESVLMGAEWDAIAHTSPATHTMTDKVAELGLKGAIAWFNEGAAE
ncbi:enoyl-CoA hydratase-related protein [Diaminobutyricimonas sp. TR449]|uniref:enoyl-CoA hydratase-related protein n=1 Tax=Diaminobutyricimonas sp. TR449 TaxID=2708076 RepID=UPI00141F0FEC|nr:enoyl-CoA hydratase-related protein [Diaminobutyricimonas sp. TR449]